MRLRLALWGALLATAALAQPVQPPPATSAPVEDLLAASPIIVIGNGLIAARIARIDAVHGFYNGTRFDQAGVVTSLTLDGKEFYGPWFERTAPEVLDYTYVGDTIVAGPDSAVSGPVDEFAPLDFVAKPGPFVKIGVGVLYQPDARPYDHDRTNRALRPRRWRAAAVRTARHRIALIRLTNCQSRTLVTLTTIGLVPIDSRNLLRAHQQLKAVAIHWTGLLRFGQTAQQSIRRDAGISTKPWITRKVRRDVGISVKPRID